VIKKNNTFKPRSHLNYTTKGLNFSFITSLRVDENASYASILKGKSEVGLYAAETGFLYDKEFQALVKFLKRVTKKDGRLLVLVKPYEYYTSKPAEVRMGKGKGKIEGSLARVVYGQCICYLADMPFYLAQEILKLGAKKLSLRTVCRSYTL
jgi:large subunit ribosomal protein L16